MKKTILMLWVMWLNLSFFPPEPVQLIINNHSCTRIGKAKSYPICHAVLPLTVPYPTKKYPNTYNTNPSHDSDSLSKLHLPTLLELPVKSCYRVIYKFSSQISIVLYFTFWMTCIWPQHRRQIIVCEVIKVHAWLSNGPLHLHYFLVNFFLNILRLLLKLFCYLHIRKSIIILCASIIRSEECWFSASFSSHMSDYICHLHHNFIYSVLYFLNLKFFSSRFHDNSFLLLAFLAFIKHTHAFGLPCFFFLVFQKFNVLFIHSFFHFKFGFHGQATLCLF